MGSHYRERGYIHPRVSAKDQKAWVRAEHQNRRFQTLGTTRRQCSSAANLAQVRIGAVMAPRIQSQKGRRPQRPPLRSSSPSNRAASNQRAAASCGRLVTMQLALSGVGLDDRGVRLEGRMTPRCLNVGTTIGDIDGRHRRSSSLTPLV